MPERKKYASRKETPWVIMERTAMQEFIRSNYVDDWDPSFIRDELPGYLNVFAFAMYPPHNKLEKMEVLLNLAFQNRQIIRYRDFYQAKSKVVDDF